jgi:suppressor of ftsI
MTYQNGSSRKTRAGPSHLRFAVVVGMFAIFGAQACNDGAERVAGPLSLPLVASAARNQDLIQPPTLSSANGILDVTLRAAPAYVSIGGQQVFTTLFNGTYLPPTLRVKRGDLLRVTLVNASDMMTNLHTHGLEVSPKGISDNIFRMAMPGQSLTYEYRIGSDHPAGTFWYHPHVHGNASAQTKFGLSGVIIVEGMQEEIPALRGLTERVLVLKDAQLSAGAIDTALEIGVNTTRTVNGVVNPTIPIQAGEAQLWRISNQSANLYYRLTLDGHKLYQVGRDGNHLNSMQALDEVVLVPGSRADVVVKADPNDGGRTFELSALPVQTGAAGDSYDAALIATVSVQGNAGNSFDVSSVAMAPLPDLRPQVTRSRGITFQQSRDGLGFMVNGQDFDVNQVNTRVKLGAVERWTIHNTTNEWHVFHIHQVEFQVVEVNGKAVPFDGYRDVVNVPDKGSVTVIIPFNKPTVAGKYVYHCHILDHEDRGMMAVIQVE